MDRTRRVHQLWSWLPAFRAVAETEHLPTAAKALFVSPSALSRSVRLLEDDLGVRLFRREGRRLVLNEHGQQLLARTRDAMRLVHEAIEGIHGEPMAGTVRVASAGVVTTPYVVPALAALMDAWPEMSCALDTVKDGDVVGALTRGRIDVAFQSVPVQADGLQLVPLGEVSNGVWASEDHPLARAPALGLDDLADVPFAAPPPDDQGRTWDGWPHGVPRRIRMTIGQMHVGLEAIASGAVVGLLPDVVAARHGRLTRLPVDPWPATPVFAVRRNDLGVEDAASRVIAAVRAQLAG